MPRPKRHPPTHRRLTPPGRDQIAHTAPGREAQTRGGGVARFRSCAPPSPEQGWLARGGGEGEGESSSFRKVKDDLSRKATETAMKFIEKDVGHAHLEQLLKELHLELHLEQLLISLLKTWINKILSLLNNNNMAIPCH